MIDFFRTLLVSGVALMFFMIVYRLLIRNRVSFVAMRFSLLFILFSSCLLPFLQLDLGWTKVDFDPALPSVFSFDDFVLTENKGSIEQQEFVSAWSIPQLLMGMYGLMIGVLMLRLIKGLVRFVDQVLSNEMIEENNYRYILVNEAHQAAAFMNYIIISKAIWDSEDKLLIVRHERAHVRQWHSIDRFLTEVLYVFQWGNPFIYWFRKDLTEVHEFLADQEVISSGVDVIDYQQLIAKYAHQSLSLSLGNQLNHSLTLNRIKMIVQHKSQHQHSFFRTLSLFPVALVLLCLFAFQQPNVSLDPTNGDYILPIAEGSYWTSSEFGMREHPATKAKKMHTGVDFVAEIGTPVLAVRDAKVLRIEYTPDKGYGKSIVLGINDQMFVLYAHLSKIDVEVGQIVKQGEVIGAVGNTGKSIKPHLHFEMIEGEEKVDPKVYLPKYKMGKDK